VQDIVAKSTGSSADFNPVFDVSGNANGFIGCIVFDAVNSHVTGATAGFRIIGTSATGYVINCISHNNEQHGFIKTGTGGTGRFYNCTSYGNAGIGFKQFSGTAIRTNCISQGDSAATEGTWTSNSCKDGLNPTFVNVAGDDFHLASGDTIAKDAGESLSADPSFAFDDDINDGIMGGGKAGETRSGTWDVGFDEYVAPPSPPSGFIPKTTIY
jgi:hypothetical protein